MQVHLSADPEAAMDAAEDFLCARPVEHNLVLTLLRRRILRPEPGRYAWVAEGEEVLGVFFQSPPDFFATATPMPAAATDALVAAVAAEEAELAGINADAATSARFAGEWANRRRVPADPVAAHRLYRCDAVAGQPPVPGRARSATEDDLDLLVAWNRAFAIDTGEDQPVSDPDAAGRHLLASRHPWVWEDDGLACLVAATPVVSGVGRLGPIYTPPERRRRGYAAALTAHATEAILQTGAVATLFTQLTNPTSNALYQRLGYVPVCENVRYQFGTPPSRD